jgi:hypothetical protein
VLGDEWVSVCLWCELICAFKTSNTTAYSRVEAIKKDKLGLVLSNVRVIEIEEISFAFILSHFFYISH